MAAAWQSGARGFSAANVSSLATAAFTIGGSDTYLEVLVYTGAGTPQNLTSVVWDAAGANQALTQVESYITFNTNFRVSKWALVNPTAGTSKVVTATWAGAQDETMVIADAYTGIDQTTPARTRPTPAQGTSSTPTLSVTSVSGDLVVGAAVAGISSADLTTISSSAVTVREKVEGADIGGHEQAVQGDVTASGTSTSVGFTLNTAGTTPIYVLFGAALIPSSAAATATTLTGPASGLTGVASTNFTVGANGPITGTVTVTPSDAGAGGTFTPTSVAISSGTPTQTFTYTPASAGTKAISISDDGGLTDATPLSYISLVRHYPVSDLVTTGWTWDGASAASALNDGSNATAALSPIITGSQGPLIMPLDTALPAGTHTRLFTAEWVDAASEIQISLLDSSNVVQGQSLWIAVVDPLTTYSASITTTGVATRIQVAVRTPARYALDFPSNVSGGDTSAPFVAFQKLNPQSDGLPIWGPGGAGVTIIYKKKHRTQTGYYAPAFWWSDASDFLWDSGSPNSYWGAGGPYPTTGTNAGTSHIDEIATGSGSDFTTTRGGGTHATAKDVWVTQAIRITKNGDSTKTLVYYLDLPSTANANVIEASCVAGYGETNPPAPALTCGDSPWFADFQHERFSGLIDAVKIVAIVLSEADTLSEAADMSQMVTAAGIANIWWGKDGFTSVDDLTCSFGTGRTLTWADEFNKATLATRA